MGADLIAYPFGGGGFSEQCGCKFHCVPQFGARYDAIIATRSKAGFSEFGTASTPPKKFLVRSTFYRMFIYNPPPEPPDPAILGPHYWTAWRREVMDIDTEDVTVTDSAVSIDDWAASVDSGIGASAFWASLGLTGGPDALPSPFGNTGGGGAAPGTSDIKPSSARGIWIHTESGGPTFRLEVIVTLEAEYTTAMLKLKTEEILPSWGSFPSDPPDSGDGMHAYSVASGICYSQGVVWNTGASRLILPNYRNLSTDELTFTVQRMLYKVVFPSEVVGSFTVKWDEVFVAEGSTLAGAPIAAHVECSATVTDTESDLVYATEWKADGEVFVSNVRFAA